MGNLVGLDLFLQIKKNGELFLYYYSPAAQTQIHQITSRKSELITASHAAQMSAFET